MLKKNIHIYVCVYLCLRILPLDNVNAELPDGVLEVKTEEGALRPVGGWFASTTYRPLGGCRRAGPRLSRARHARPHSAHRGRCRTNRPLPCAACVCWMQGI